MKISQSGLDAIKQHEGLRLAAYPDPASGGDPWTIGYGHTAGVQRGQTITHAQAEQFLRQDLAWVETCIATAVAVPLTQGQYDALCGLIFNIGATAFRNSTMLRMLNQRDYAGAAEQFGRWNIAAGKVNRGLTNRRAAERALFLSDSPPPAVVAPAPAQPKEPPVPIAIAPFVAAALPSIIEAIPRLGKLFGSGSPTSERNIKAAEVVVELVRGATGATNAQEAAERVTNDPAARQQAEAAVVAHWLDLTEAGGGGVEGARAADAAAMAAGGPWWGVLRSPSFVIAGMLLPLVYLIVGNVAGLYGAEWSPDARAGLAGSVAGGIVMGLIGYYFGQTTSRNRTPAP